MNHEAGVNNEWFEHCEVLMKMHSRTSAIHILWETIAIKGN